jgi:L-iditol 2-dehydrogenase
VRVAYTRSLADTTIEERPDPVAGPGEVVCRVLACATCGSDVQDWYVDRKLPAVLGHEPAGEVVEVGAGVEGVAAGDRVAIHHHAPCGACPRCAAGHETLCERFRSTALDPGGFAEYVRVERDLVGELLPIGDLDPVLATFTEPLGCAIRAQDRARLTPGDALLVVGAGASGLLHVAAARARGVEHVRISEPDAGRRERAQAWGAVRHDGEPADVAIVCTPRPDAILAAADALGPGGRLCLYAPPAPGSPLGVDGNAIFMRELELTASWSAGPADMRAALEMLRTGAVDPVEMVQLRVPLEETGRALRAQKSGEALKAVVLP